MSISCKHVYSLGSSQYFMVPHILFFSTFGDFPHLFRALFLHRYFMCFGKDVGCMLAPFWYRFPCFLATDFWMIFWMLFSWIWSIKVRRISMLNAVLFRPCSPVGVLGAPSAHFGILLVPFWSLWAAIRLHFARFRPSLHRFSVPLLGSPFPWYW